MTEGSKHWQFLITVYILVCYVVHVRLSRHLSRRDGKDGIANVPDAIPANDGKAGKHREQEESQTDFRDPFYFSELWPIELCFFSSRDDHLIQIIRCW